MNYQKMELGKKMDDAFQYVAYKLRETGHNTKPVLFHSFKVAYQLYKYNYSEEVVISAILHDLIEDTNVKKEDIANKFGDVIANIVSAVSFDPNIKDEVERTRVMFRKCLDCGASAVIVKCSDLLDNIDYVMFVEDKEKRNLLLSKYKLFLTMSRSMIGNTKIYMDLLYKVEMY